MDIRGSVGAGLRRALVGFPNGLAARSREVPSRIMRDKTARQDNARNSRYRPLDLDKPAHPR